MTEIDFATLYSRYETQIEECKAQNIKANDITGGIELLQLGLCICIRKQPYGKTTKYGVFVESRATFIDLITGRIFWNFEDFYPFVIGTKYLYIQAKFGTIPMMSIEMPLIVCEYMEN